MYGPWRGDPPGYVHHDAWWGFWHFLPFLMFLILIGLGVWAVLRFSSRPLVAGSRASGAAPPPVRDAALEELRIRYARGELGREDFSQRMRDLGHPDVGPAQTAVVGDDAPPAQDAPDQDG